jgi:hypothetical protein
MISPKMREAPEGAPDSRLALAAKCGSVIARDFENAESSLAHNPDGHAAGARRSAAPSRSSSGLGGPSRPFTGRSGEAKR